MARGSTTGTLNALAATSGKTAQECLNILAGASGHKYSKQQAWNLYAGTTGLSAQGAANVKAGTVGKSIQDCINIIAGNSL